MKPSIPVVIFSVIFLGMVAQEGWLRTRPAVVPVVAEPVAPKVCSPAWSCGHLARGEAGMKKDVWYLKYDDVGGTGQLEIVFTEGASCLIDGAAVDCGRMNPPNGTGSSFSGKKVGETFVVSHLEFTTPR